MELTGVLSIILFFAVPIVAIVLSIVSHIKRNRLEAEIRKEILRSGASLEMAQELLKKPVKQHQHDRMATLRWGCILAGIGLAALICKFMGLYISDVYTWIYFALGGGVGLVVAFVVEMLIAKQNKKESEE